MILATAWGWGRHLLPVAAYLCGSVPFGFLAARLVRGVDIRETGSRNIGATNAARALGFRYFPLLVLLDLAKGFLPTLAAQHVVPAGDGAVAPLAILTGIAAIVGHVFPVFLGFRGGKAVATGGGVFLALSPWAVLAAGLAWGVVFALTRYVSLASIVAAVVLPVAVWFRSPDVCGVWDPLTAFAAVAGAFVIYRHRGNIRRLLDGTENRIGRPRTP
ncbi:MAG: glycerol-3-phosphate 1-O-acyltransferase PlsY [Candidatus Brocadiaceae bacterium]|nr:glycerol-3-phosphate 1-O-acyltransferase PlsY [Candidatus Brocadiaceae bacterium]